MKYRSLRRQLYARRTLLSNLTTHSYLNCPPGFLARSAAHCRDCVAWPAFSIAVYCFFVCFSNEECALSLWHFVPHVSDVLITGRFAD